MNQCFRLVASLSFMACTLHAEPLPLLPPVAWKVVETNVVLDIGQHHRTVGKVKQFTDKQGNSYSTTNKITELATGMHYNEKGLWKQSEASFEIVNGYAVAGKLGHRLVLAPDINTEGAVDFTTTDGKRMRSHVVGVGYRDRKTGDSVLLGEITNSVGWVVSPNQAVYSNCFNGLSCSLRYTVTRGGMEQDLIFHEAPDVSEFNFESGDLELYSEFLEVPEPVKSVTYAGEGEKGALVENEDLSFGAMKIGEGYAFLADGTDKGDQHPVNKWFGTIKGRKVLIESLPFGAVSKDLASLKPQTKAIVKRTVNKDRSIPLLVQKTKTTERQFAKLTPGPRSPELILDYSITGSLTDQTFFSDTTYLVTGDVTLDGNTVFEGGTVIKYTNNVSMTINSGPTTFKTEPYRPVTFTAVDDNSVGETISGSTGTPTNYYAAYALVVLSTNQFQADNVKFYHADIAIGIGNRQRDNVLQNAQFVHCGRGVFGSRSTLTLRNDLFYNIGTNFYFTLSNPTGICENVTFHLADTMSKTAATGQLYLTNCLVVAVTNWGDTTSSSNTTIVLASDSGIFKTLGAASHYLATDSIYRNAGSTNVSTATLALLKRRTTYPPILIGTGSPAYWGNTNISMFPQAMRDSDAPDLGYHYDPIDYVLGGLYITNCAFTASAGTVMSAAASSYGGYGIAVRDDSSFVVQGDPAIKSYFVEYNTAQEQSNTNWAQYKANFIYTPWNTTIGAPNISFKFTDFCSMALDAYTFYGYYYYSNLTPTVFSGCQFKGGNFLSNGDPINATNCLFQKVATLILTYGGPTNAINFRNCLFYQGAFTQFLTGNDAITCFNSQFDSVTMGSIAAGTVFSDYNAYTTNMTRLSPNGAHDLTASSFSYETGPLGSFYQPTNSTLINAGNVSNALNVGLYHYTTTTNQVKEAMSVLDIGYHYMAVGSNGLANDADGDGIPDYLEDLNGNMDADSGETHWQVATDGGLYVHIHRPKTNSSIP